MPPVNYLRVVGCEYVAAKGVERNEGYRISHRSSKKPMNAHLYNKLINNPPKIANSTSTDVTLRGA